MTNQTALTLAILVLLGVASFAPLYWPRRPVSRPQLLDSEGHRRCDPPINLRVLDQAVARGE